MDKELIQKQILAHYLNVDKKIHKVLAKMDPEDWLEHHAFSAKTNNYFSSLCRSIIGQQLSVKVADTIHNRFVGLIGKDIALPEDILNIEDTELRNIGMSWSKVKYLKDLAEKVNSKDIDLTILDSMEDEEVINELVKVKGIGRWTAEMFLIFTLSRPNVFSHGDLGLKRGFSKVYGIEEPSQEDIEKVVSKWHPYKSYGSIALWSVLDNLPA